MTKDEKRTRKRISGHLRNHSLIVLNTFSSKVVNLIPTDKLPEYLAIRRNFEKIL